MHACMHVHSSHQLSCFRSEQYTRNHASCLRATTQTRLSYDINTLRIICQEQGIDNKKWTRHQEQGIFRGVNTSSFLNYKRRENKELDVQPTKTWSGRESHVICIKWLIIYWYDVPYLIYKKRTWSHHGTEDPQAVSAYVSVGESMRREPAAIWINACSNPVIAVIQWYTSTSQASNALQCH